VTKISRDVHGSFTMMDCIEALLEHNFACREPLLSEIGKMDYSEFISDQGVGRSSIRNLLVHLVNTEIYWMQTVLGDGIKTEMLKEEEFQDVNSILNQWQRVEAKTREIFKNQNEETLQYVKSVRWGNRTVSFTVAKVFIHMTTHEVHHRGLIVGLLRKLGYEPPKVDML